LLDLGRERTSIFGLPVDDIDVLEKRLRASKGGKTRRETMRLLVFARLREAGASADARASRRHRKRAVLLAGSLSKVTRDANVSAEMAFAELWLAWRAGRRNAGGLASRFVRRHRGNHELLYLAWTLRGEVAFEGKRYREAEKHFRYLLGVPGHPLYAFALYRSADCYDSMKKKDEADKALKEVVNLGCRDDASLLVMRVVKQAMQRLRIPMRDDIDGKSRPAVCPRPAPVEAQ
jgi:tetratricopeptide (TPR) repeat protein